jgi:hypothetical protein
MLKSILNHAIKPTIGYMSSSSISIGDFFGILNDGNKSKNTLTFDKSATCRYNLNNEVNYEA